MKLQKIYLHSLLEMHGDNHPLSALIREIVELNTFNYNDVETFFNNMELPDGYYSLIESDDWGYHIRICEEYISQEDLKNECDLNAHENASPE